MSDVLEGATNHFNFPELLGGKIILSERAYIRLSADINLCAYSGNKELEYGTFLYGREIAPNTILFDSPSAFDDYEPTFREFNVNVDENGNESKMLRELHQNINNPKYNCIAHIHTHPYIGGTCRFFSNQDLRTIRSLQDGFQPSDGRKVYFLGGLLTVGKGNNPDDDEISFVFHDDTHGWYKVTNITVMQNNTEIPFARTNNRTKMREI